MLSDFLKNSIILYYSIIQKKRLFTYMFTNYNASICGQGSLLTLQG